MCKILSVKGVNSWERYETLMKETNCQKDLEMINSSTLSWTANCEKRVEKALKPFHSIKRSISGLCSPKMKLDKYCGYIVPIVPYASQAWYANKTELREVKKVQKKAVSWTIGNPELQYYPRLIVAKLLPLSPYLERHDIQTMKLLADNSYGYQIMDRSRHTVTKNLSDENTCRERTGRLYET